jgi:REP element-mobilizing transposase RayT
MTERLHRLERLYTSNPTYYLTFCTSDRKPILGSKEIHNAFCDFCNLGLERNIFVGRFVLMPDHVHLFVKFSNEQTDLSIWVKSLKNSLSKTLRETGIVAPHWQKGFFDHVLRSGESYSEKWMYMVENPVRAGLVKEWKDWPYQGEIFILRFE